MRINKARRDDQACRVNNGFAGDIGGQAVANENNFVAIQEDVRFAPFV